MDTKARKDSTKPAEPVDDSASFAEAKETSAGPKGGTPRTIREMVINNNRRFAATMKSLGE